MKQYLKKANINYANVTDSKSYIYWDASQEQKPLLIIN